ncbi:hypothetical protein [Akkermansia sp.]|uniref:hypothetical protein n=1 Tax=Akkermansia sp. TaxID=1872421 RepID=UPI001D80E366|nr:hypothetical protein [Akkermansia sp.]MBE5696587.1 hypothetical protein [Akkermansia sp.]
MKFFKTPLVMATLLGCLPTSPAEVAFPGPAPGTASAEQDASGYTLSNNILTAKFILRNGSLSFGGMTSKLGPVAKAGDELFIINLQDGRSIKSSELKAGNVKFVSLQPNPKAFRLADRFPGKAVSATFQALNGTFRISWRAVLRDHSHYLRQELRLASTKPVQMKNIVAMQYDLVEGKAGAPSVSGNARGALIVNDLAFTALETPMGINTVGGAGNMEGGETAIWSADKWSTASWTGNFNVPQELKKQYGEQVSSAEGPVSIDGKGACTVTFQYKGGDKGNNKLNLAGVQLLSSKGAVLDSDFHNGSTGDSNAGNTYTVQVPSRGNYILRYWAQTKSEPIASKGEITFSLPVRTLAEKQEPQADESRLAQGLWSRKTTLQPGEIWDVSSVLGIFAPGQQRRSFLAYMERERVMPYRPFIHYNSWYELNINRNNDSDPAKRMTEEQCLSVLKDWQEQFYQKRGISIDAFVWDDGWDEFNSLWDFHKMFPQGFKRIDAAAGRQKAGIGTWLGPVGGYGASKGKRLAYWNVKHPDNKIGNFQLSNKEYFDAFVGRCSQMVKDYNMKYFKFDGISTHFHAKGPGNEEDAEGIIRVLNALRKKKGDLYINCTVGTWASPFWFRYADSVWRQENDFGTIGAGDNRDKWITYRDRLVHEVFVQGSPLMPINSMMTHGLMVTKFGPPACMPRDPENVKKELRCATACGTSLQELYVDRDLMNANGGVLWDELAKGIKWIRRNADVLDDVHWVGGNPWNKETNEGAVYGWAAWNKNKATLALRNSSDQEKSLTGTLRSILDIPANVKGSITFKDSYDDQRTLDGFSGSSVDIDKEISFTLKPFEVLVYEGGKVK